MVLLKNTAANIKVISYKEMKINNSLKPVVRTNKDRTLLRRQR